MVSDQGTKNWTESHKYCIDTYGTSLAITPNYGDIVNLLDYVHKSDIPYQSIWIGLTDYYNTEGIWQ